MPINASPEYWKAVKKFENAKGIDEKIKTAERVVSECPNHKGAENLRARWKRKLSKLKKQKKSKKGGGKKTGIQKEGEAQVCLIGLPNSGKSTLLKRITDAEPKIADYPYTTQKPKIGAMDYKGVKVQIVEIPATMQEEWMSIAHSADENVLVYRNKQDKKRIEKIKEKYALSNIIFLKSDEDDIKDKIWNELGLIIAYTKDGKETSPMALPEGSTVEDFARKIHKDFVKNFRFARLFRNGMEKQVGKDYEVKDGDKIELHT